MAMDIAVLAVAVAAALVAVGLLGWRRYRIDRDTPAAVKLAQKRLRAAHSGQKRVLRPIDRALAQHRKSLASLTSSSGRKLGKYAKITLYELRVETPSGGGELSRDVDAFVDDATSSRFTATRFLAFGGFGLAFKKKTGKIFLSIDHPNFVHLSTVGPKERERATKFAAKVKNAGRQAETIRIERPREAERVSALIAELERKRTEVQSKHVAIVHDAERHLEPATRPKPSQQQPRLSRPDQVTLSPDPWGP